MISSNRRSATARGTPFIAAFMKMFSRALNSSSKPAPSSISETTRPRPFTRPSVGWTIFARTLRRVLLPAPLAPMMPSTEP